MRTKPLIEQHFHGAFGVDFNTASTDDILFLSKKIKEYGIGGIFPTIVTDSVENTKAAIAKIKKAATLQTADMAKIFGIHLEGIFLNPQKKGIHNPNYFMPLEVENYKLIEDEFIKIVTLAPELDEGLLEYLTEKKVKIQAGHCVGGDLTKCSGATHLFNAMSGIMHRESSTTLSALIDDDIYIEVIADGVHVCDEALKLVFKTKPQDKIILVSDSLPIAKSHLKERMFAGEKIYYDGIRATSKAGTLAGSTSLLSDIVKRLADLNIFNPAWIDNPYNYHDIDLNYEIEWDENWNYVK